MLPLLIVALLIPPVTRPVPMPSPTPVRRAIAPPYTPMPCAIIISRARLQGRPITAESLGALFDSAVSAHLAPRTKTAPADAFAALLRAQQGAWPTLTAEMIYAALQAYAAVQTRAIIDFSGCMRVSAPSPKPAR